jgi:hypothetical protein
LPVSAQQPSAGDRASGRFTLETIKRSYNLKAADGADMDDWTTSIREVIARADTAAGDEVTNADGACKGWLWKKARGGVRHHWKRRFVVLTTPAPGSIGEAPPRLAYYHTEAGGEARGALVLSASHITLEVLQRQPGERHGWTFEISTWDKGDGESANLMLSTESSAVLEAWVGALKAAVPHLRPPGELEKNVDLRAAFGFRSGGGFGKLDEDEGEGDMQQQQAWRQDAWQAQDQEAGVAQQRTRPETAKQEQEPPPVIEQDFLSFVRGGSGGGQQEQERAQQPAAAAGGAVVARSAKHLAF